MRIICLLSFSQVLFGTATLKPKHENLPFVAVADGSTVFREQENLSYHLEFNSSNPGINITGVSLIPNTLGSATFIVTTVSPTVVKIELLAGTAAPADFNSALGGALNLSWSHDGVISNVNLNIQLRAVSNGASVVFENYSSANAADSDISPLSINGLPPFGADRYVWTTLPPSSPIGMTFSLLNHDGLVPGNRRWPLAGVGAGPAWTNQNTTFKVEFHNFPNNIIHRPVIRFDLRLRSFSDLTIYQGQSLFTLFGPISATGAAPGGYSLSTTVDDGSTISLHPDLGSVDGYTPAAGWDTDTEMDVNVTDGAFCTTLTVRDLNVRFRSLKGDGFTLFKGHIKGEGIINIGLANDGFVVTQLGGASAFPLIAATSGTTPLLTFRFDGSVDGFTTPPPSNQWNTDDTFEILIKDGSRPTSSVPRAVSFRELPNDLSYFDQQESATSATSPTGVGPYGFFAIDPSWLVAPPGVPPLYLAGSSPQPSFSSSGQLINYLNGAPSPSMYTNRLLITNEPRPWSAGTQVDFYLRHIAFNGIKVDVGNPVEIPQDGNFIIQAVDGGTSWHWSDANLIDFNTGSVSVPSSQSASANLSSVNVTGTGSLVFDLGPTSTSAFHPTITIVLDAFGGIVVPLNLLAFTAKALKNKVSLQWKVESGFAINHFEIWKSQNQLGWKLLGSIKKVSSSSTLHTHQYLDNDPASGFNYYQLRIIDDDGKEQFSDIRSIRFEKEELVKSTYTVGETITINSEGPFTLYTITGQKVLESPNSRLVIPNIPTGNYFIRSKYSFYKIWIMNH